MSEDGKRFAQTIRLGLWASQTVVQRQATATEDSKVAQTMGFSRSKGSEASRFGVSVCSENPVLQQELTRLA